MKSGNLLDTVKIKTEIFLIAASWFGIFLISYLAFAHIYWNELLIGWSVAYMNHLFDWKIKEQSMQKAPQEAVRRLTVVNLIRFLLLLTIVFCIISFLLINHVAFIYSLMFSYIIFMTSDLMRYYQIQKDSYGSKL